MKKQISLKLESLDVESFETDAPPVVGDVDFVQWTNASARPCSACCPEW